MKYLTSVHNFLFPSPAHEVSVSNIFPKLQCITPVWLIYLLSDSSLKYPLLLLFSSISSHSRTTFPGITSFLVNMHKIGSPQRQEKF